MFAQNLHLHLKPNSVAEFTRTIEKEVIPCFESRRAFRMRSTFVTPSGTEVVGVSLWDEKEDAEAYERRAFPAVLKALEKVADGTPEIQTYEVANSTFHKIATKVAVQQRGSLSPYLWPATKNPDQE